MQPDVVVMDIAMPELNGIDAAAQVVDVSPDTRVIILSMYSSNEDIFRALQVGALGYVLKESAGRELAPLDWPPTAAMRATIAATLS